MHTADLFLLIFVWVDDVLKRNPEVVARPGPKSEVSDSELLTLLLVQALCGAESDLSWLRRVDRDFWALFPKRPEYSRYQRRRRLLAPVCRVLLEHLCEQLDSDTRVRIVDSAPIAVCHNVRANTCGIFVGEAAWGRCEAKRSYFYGFRLHLMITERGLPVAWKVLAANHHDRVGLDQLLAGQVRLDVYGDKAYHVRPRDREALGRRHITLTAPPRKDMKRKPPPEKLAKLDDVRFKVDWGFGHLIQITDFEHTRARTLASLESRIAFKLAAYGLAQGINTLVGRPRMHVKSLLN